MLDHLTHPSHTGKPASTDATPERQGDAGASAPPNPFAPTTSDTMEALVRDARRNVRSRGVAAAAAAPAARFAFD